MKGPLPLFPILSHLLTDLAPQALARYTPTTENLQALQQSKAADEQQGRVPSSAAALREEEFSVSNELSLTKDILGIDSSAHLA